VSMAKENQYEYWNHKTRTGRVVYDRKPHVFKYRDVARILTKLSETEYTDEFIAVHGFGINASYIILQKSGYAALRNYILHNAGVGGAQQLGAYGVPENALVSAIYRAVDGLLKRLVQEAAQAAAKAIALKFGVPEELYDFIAGIIWDPLWDLIDSTLGQLIRDMRGIQ